MTLTRPGTLAHVLRLVGEGETLRFCMAGFLDEFYGDPSDRSRAARIADFRVLQPTAVSMVPACQKRSPRHTTPAWVIASKPRVSR
jgi:hypothetical protein